jgi:hypothetical protein
MTPPTLNPSTLLVILSKLPLTKCSMVTNLLMLKELSMSKPQTNLNCINATVTIKIPLFLKDLASVSNIPTAQDLLLLKETAHLLTQLHQSVPSLIVGAVITNWNIQFSHHIPLFSAIKSLTLTVKEEFSQELWTTRKSTDLLMLNVLLMMPLARKLNNNVVKELRNARDT